MTSEISIRRSEAKAQGAAAGREPETPCCVVGGGPAGVILAFLLARSGVRVTLLEGHKDFDRDFRGDTIHPSVLEILDQVGLAERLHRLPHAKIYGPTIRTADGRFSRVRHLAGLNPVKTSPPIDVLWFRLPHLEGELEVSSGLLGRFGRGHVPHGDHRNGARSWRA